MTTENRSPLELDVVVQRFAESADALSNVREQLRILTKLREAEEEAKASIAKTAEQIERFVGEAAKALKGLQQAQTRASEVLAAGADLLDGTELKTISEVMQADSQTINRIDKRTESLNEMVTALPGQIKRLEDIVKGNASAISRIDGQVSALDTKMSGVADEIRQISEMTLANSQAISAIDSRFDDLESQLSEILAASKEPKIVKRFF